jgi:protein-tyrosine phosphatase
MKVLFVCLGNICRSPLAQGVLDAWIVEKNKTNILTDSAGTSNYHLGKKPDSRTIQNAMNHGVSLPYFARQIEKNDFYNFDYLLVMDDNNLKDVLHIKPANSTAVIAKLRTFDPIDTGADVDDPYFGGAEGFELVFQTIKRSVYAFANQKL